MGSGLLVVATSFGKAVQHFNVLEGGEASYAETTQALFFSCLGVAVGFGGLWAMRDEIVKAEIEYGVATAWIIALTGIVAASLVATGLTLLMIGAPVFHDEMLYSFFIWSMIGFGIIYFKAEAAKTAK